VDEIFTVEEDKASAFICRCNAEAEAEADRIRAVVHDRLNPFQGEMPDSIFLTTVVISLNWDHHAYISSIHCDQWSMVTAKTYDSVDNPFKVSVQCDNVEDGIAAVWLAFSDRALDNNPEGDATMAGKHAAPGKPDQKAGSAPRGAQWGGGKHEKKK